MRALILSAAPVPDYSRIQRYLAETGAPDVVICADGGVRHLQPLGLAPTLVLGDFDSAGTAVADRMEERGIPVKRVPWEKDETDTDMAMREAVRMGATEIILVGGTGDRLDHTIANVLLIPGLPEHITATIVDAKNLIRVLRPGKSMEVHRREGTFLSLLPLTPEATGVVVKGVKWPLHGVTLRWGESLGVSNQIEAESAFVATSSGYLLVVQASD